MDGFTGIVSNGYELEDLADAIQRAMSIGTEKWRVILQNAHDAAQMTCCDEVVRYQLFKLYNVGVEEHRRLNGSQPLSDESIRRTRFLFQIQPSGGRSAESQQEEVFARRMTILGLKYQVRVPNDYWNALIISFGTYMQMFHEKIEITIREAKAPHRLVRRVELDGDTIPDNDPIAVYFDPVPDCAGKEMQVSIRAKSAQARPLLSVYETGRRVTGFRHYLQMLDNRGGKLMGSLMFAPPPVKKETRESK